MSSVMRRSVKTLRTLAESGTRRVHSSAPKGSTSGGVNVLQADDGKLGTKLYHGVNLVLLAGLPAAIITSPSAITMPLDVVLGVALPVHAHIGMNYVITDYIPRASRRTARGVMLAATVMATLGLLKLNISGPGLTETLKATWRKTKGAADTESAEDTKPSK